MNTFCVGFSDLRQIVVADMGETADEERSKLEFAQSIEQREQTVPFSKLTNAAALHR